MLLICLWDRVVVDLWVACKGSKNGFVSVASTLVLQGYYARQHSLVNQDTNFCNGLHPAMQRSNGMDIQPLSIANRTLLLLQLNFPHGHCGHGTRLSAIANRE